MVLFFTGTGNSAHAAKLIAEKLGDTALDLFEKLRNNDNSALFSEKPWVVVSPTYCWQIPRLLRDWLMNTPLEGNKNIWFVMTCGDDTGNAAKYLKELCAAKGLHFMGHLPVPMPENYLAMFDTPGDEQAAKKISEAEPIILNGAERIASGLGFDPVPVTLVGRLYSGIVNLMFYPLCVKDKKFTATEKCISCGKCETLCPMGNITLNGGRPEWHGNCTHCMACISRCPAGAIEYGNVSKGKNRYHIDY